MIGLDRAFGAVLWMIAALWSVPLWAQSLEVAGNRFPIGVAVDMAVTLPEVENLPSFELGIAPAGTTRVTVKERFYKAGREVRQVRVPEEPGRYEVVLRQQDGGVVQIIPIETVFRPQPGLLQVSDTQVSGGGTVTVSATIPEGVYRASPWVGLFATGRNAEGGASIADHRLRWDNLPKDGAPLTLRMPPWKGTYEVRLFDRSGGTYVLDAAQITVIEDPAPGIMAIDQEVYEVGQPVTVTVTLDKERQFDSPWIGMYDINTDQPGGALRQEVRLRWDWLNKKTLQMTMPAPNYPGTFELRLSPTGGTWRRVLDTVTFRTQVSPQPGALGLEQTDFVVGQRITVPVQLAEGTFTSSAWVGLFETSPEPTPGQAPRSLARLTYEWVPRDGSPLSFNAPAWPGTYELRLYDRNERRFVLDRQTITVTAPPTPGVLSSDQPTYEVGTPITVTAQLEPDRYYGGAYVGLYRLGSDDVPGGAEEHDTRAQWARVKPGEPVTLGAQNRPGDYEIRLYDRDSRGFVLDTLPIRVVASPAPGSLALNKEVYAIGEELIATVSLPEGRYFYNGYLGLNHTSGPSGPDLAPWEHHRHEWIRVKPDTTEYRMRVPATQGEYEVVLYDRDGWAIVLDRVAFRAEAPPRDLLRIQRRQYQTGETIMIQTRWPEGLSLVDPGVALYASGYALPGGGVSVEKRITSKGVKRGQNTIELPAPDQPGAYELRFYDRNDRFYILDIERFNVTDPDAPGMARDPLRLTPMPGEGRQGALPPTVQPAAQPADPRPEQPATPAETPAGDTPDDAPENSPANAPESAGNDGDTSGDSPASDPAKAGEPTLVALEIMVLQEGGLTPATRLSPGDSFLLRARYDGPLDQPTVTASVDLGGQAVQVTLHPDGTGQGFASPVMQVPMTGGEEQ